MKDLVSLFGFEEKVGDTKLYYKGPTLDALDFLHLVMFCVAMIGLSLGFGSRTIMGTDKKLKTVETFDGETMTLAELINKIGVKPEEIIISFKGGTTVTYTEKNPEDDVTVSS